MLGTLARLLAGSHCTCDSCRSLHELHLRTTFRRWQLVAASGEKPRWDEDLSEADLEVLARAGWTEADVQAHVELLQKMVIALVSSHPPPMHPEPIVVPDGVA